MRRIAAIAAIVFLLGAMTPVLACVTGSAMARQESACCHAMHGDCQQKAKRTCCRIEIQRDQNPLGAATSPAADIHNGVHWICVLPLEPLVVFSRPNAAALPEAPDEGSPPALLATKVTILRI